MITPNVEERLITVINKLRDWRIVRQEFLPVVYTDEVKDKKVLPKDQTNWKTFEPPYTIFEQEKYFWFKANFSIKPANEYQRGYFIADTHIDISCNSSTIRPQGLFYANGELMQGVDINHGDVLLKEGEYESYLLFYTHSFNRSLPLDFSIRYIDERVERLYYDLYVPFQGLRLLDKRSNDYVNAVTVLEKALNILDLRNVHSEEFYKSVVETSEFLHKNYYNGVCGSQKTVNLIGHTHIDVAWLWPLDQTKQKVERSFATVLKLMDEYPEYRFFMSQPQLFAFLKERNPELYAKVKEKILEGRWEVDGAMWVEADCNLTSGESLVRQIAYGKRFFKEEFNKDCDAIWLPDVFGYSASLPQIMKKSGLTTFITAKIGWNDTDRMPYDVFKWKGIDGSEVFAYFLSTCDCNPRGGVFDQTFTTYTAPINPMYVLGTWNRFQQKEYTDTVIMSYGWGDGGGGPTREDIEQERRLEYGLPGIPKAKIEPLSTTVAKIKESFDKNIEELGRKPVWNGELYFEYHRGTLSSVPEVKMNNRKGEFALLNAELMGVLGEKLAKQEYPKDMIDKDWRLLLVNQFHDILPGSSIGEVYSDSREQFKEIFEDTSKIVGSTFDYVCNNVKSEGGILVFNPNGFVANGTVKCGDNTLIARDIPAFGYKVLNLSARQSSVRVGEKTLENNFYKLVFDRCGNIVSLFDKREQREICQNGELINEMIAYQDTPYQYDNWEMTPYHRQNSWKLDGDAEFTPLYEGDRCGFKIVKKYGKSCIEQNVYLYEDGIDRIDFETQIDWKEKTQLLKAHFPFDLNETTALYDVQFGHVKRALHDNTSWDSARFESAAQKWVDISENNYGVALLNDGKYGFGAQDERLSMTLVKSGRFPFEGASDIIPKFTYSLVPHKGNYTVGKIVEKAYVLNRPMMFKAVDANSNGCLNDEFSLINSPIDGFIIETVKKAESGDGIVVRGFEAYKERKIANVSVPFASEVYLCDLNENEIEKLDVHNGEVSFVVKPFEIITLKIKTV